MQNPNDPTAGTPPAGYWHCDKCQHVVTVSPAQEEAAAQAPLFAQVRLKCPRCHHHAVSWHVPAPVVPPAVRAAGKLAASVERVAADPELARALFAAMRAATL